jgi:DNA-binding IclR family transcriptional regulator
MESDMKTIEVESEELSLENGDSPFQVPNLDRGLSILELLSQHPDGLILSEICRLLEIPKKSGSRILATLELRGFVKKNEKTLVFSLTSKLLRLGCGAVCERNLIEEALDDMRELRDATGESVLLNALVDGQGVVLEQVSSRNQVRLMVDPGTRYELHCTAPGKIHLAWLPERERERLLKELPLPKHTGTTITTLRRFRHELETVREQGYSVDRGEGIDGIYCVSAPVFGRNGQAVAALTVSGTAGRMPESRFGDLAEIIIHHAGQIGRRLS